VFDDLIKFWRILRATHLEKQLWGGTFMFYYMTMVLAVVGGLYVYLMWEGFIGFAVLFSHLAGSKIPTDSLPIIDVVKAAGMILIIRYSILGGLDKLAKRSPENLEPRLREIESKVGELHKLAFGEVNLPSDKKPPAKNLPSKIPPKETTKK